MDYVKYIRNLVGTKPINLTGVNVLIINDTNQVLLQKRGTFPYKWGLIGGITELGESLEDTAIRETKEETGLTVSHLKIVGTTSGEDCYIEFPNGDMAYFITVGYVARHYSGEFRTDDIETEELKFYDYNELPDNMVRSHKILIDKYYND